MRLYIRESSRHVQQFIDFQALKKRHLELPAEWRFDALFEADSRHHQGKAILTHKEFLDARLEIEIAQASLTNRPGELARAATQLGEANINIEHAYSGLDAKNSLVVFLAVKDISKAVAVLDKIAKAA